MGPSAISSMGLTGHSGGFFGPTLEFLDKKHVKFDQDLDFLTFCLGNRGTHQEKPRKNQYVRNQNLDLKNR